MSVKKYTHWILWYSDPMLAWLEDYRILRTDLRVIVVYLMSKLFWLTTSLKFRSLDADISTFLYFYVNYFERMNLFFPKLGILFNRNNLQTSSTFTQKLSLHIWLILANFSGLLWWRKRTNWLVVQILRFPSRHSREIFRLSGKLRQTKGLLLHEIIRTSNFY